MTHTATLWEDNAGHLLLVKDGDTTGYDLTEAAEWGNFRDDARALLAADTDDWTTPQLPLEDPKVMPGYEWVAEYHADWPDRPGGQVILHFATGGRARAGNAAQAYLGADYKELQWDDDPPPPPWP